MKIRQALVILVVTAPTALVALLWWSCTKSSPQFSAFEAFEEGMSKSALLGTIDGLKGERQKYDDGREFVKWRSRGVPYWHFQVYLDQGTVKDKDLETFGLGSAKKQYEAEKVVPDNLVYAPRVQKASPLDAPEFVVGEIVVFAIHSPAQLFGADDATGRTFTFSVVREIVDGSRRFSLLQIERQVEQDDPDQRR